MLSCEPVPVSGFPVLVIGVCEKGEMACQAGNSVFLWNGDIYPHYYAVSKPRTTNWTIPPSWKPETLFKLTWSDDSSQNLMDLDSVNEI
jgi:hypothetical protein